MPAGVPQNGQITKPKEHLFFSLIRVFRPHFNLFMCTSRHTPKSKPSMGFTKSRQEKLKENGRMNNNPDHYLSSILPGLKGVFSKHSLGSFAPSDSPNAASNAVTAVRISDFRLKVDRSVSPKRVVTRVCAQY